MWPARTGAPRAQLRSAHQVAHRNALEEVHRLEPGDVRIVVDNVCTVDRGPRWRQTVSGQGRSAAAAEARGRDRALGNSRFAPTASSWSSSSNSKSSGRSGMSELPSERPDTPERRDEARLSSCRRFLDGGCGTLPCAAARGTLPPPFAATGRVTLPPPAFFVATRRGAGGSTYSSSSLSLSGLRGWSGT